MASKCPWNWLEKIKKWRRGLFSSNNKTLNARLLATLANEVAKGYSNATVRPSVTSL
jgi:hypothetical protein